MRRPRNTCQYIIFTIWNSLLEGKCLINVEIWNSLSSLENGK